MLSFLPPPVRGALAALLTSACSRWEDLASGIGASDVLQRRGCMYLYADAKACRAGEADMAVRRELGVLHQAIYKWDRVPSARVLDVCRLTGLRPYDVRADLYPDPRWTL